MLRDIGINFLEGGRCEVTVWAPLVDSLSLKVIRPRETLIPMEKKDRGYWSVVTPDLVPGAEYFYRINGKTDRPDPVSAYQPQGPHNPSRAVDHKSFTWSDGAWKGIPLEEMIIYELHVGTFTPDGTFEALISKLDYLCQLGVTAVEIMPVSQFPGSRNWGYDGTYHFAVQDSYGGPEGLKKFVDASHARGLAVIMDTVYNHLGPEGNYLAEFGPYFTPRHRGPWGNAVNFDDAYSSEVRNYFIQNALHWFRNYHIDALRLDAIHGIYDMSAKHFLQELAEEVESFSGGEGRKFYLIAESDLNDVRVVRAREEGGFGIDAQWSDDFHHCLHTLLTGEDKGYYRDFGTIGDFMAALKETFVYSWKYSAYRRRYHGSDASGIAAGKFVVFAQNHDQVGNRMLGQRLSSLVPFEALKLAASAVFVSPYIPLIFMGEEFAEENPFLYFVSHTDATLVEAVRQGRKSDHESFEWDREPPDPQSEDTFSRSKLDWAKLSGGKHEVMLGFYRELISMRKSLPALGDFSKEFPLLDGDEERRLVFLERGDDKNRILCIMNFSGNEECVRLDFFEGSGKKIFDSSDEKWMGPGPGVPELIGPGAEVVMNPFSCVIYKTGV